MPGEKFHPKMAEAVDKVLAVCKKLNKPAGIFVSSPEEAKTRIAQGFTFIAYSLDTHIFLAAAKNIIGALRGLVGRVERPSPLPLLKQRRCP